MNTNIEKIILASYPRSGNTYVRNILSRVYNQPSVGDVYIKTQEAFEQSDVRFLKTHMLYERYIEQFNPYFSIAIIRDGRDAVVSGAHHRSDIVAPGSDFNQTLEESIRAKGGSYFSGWSKNIASWIPYATQVWRYEDLLDDPVAVVEQLKVHIDLPEPAVEKLPSFEEMKKGNEDYVPIDPVLNEQGLEIERHKLFFRKGAAGGWKDDMTDRQHKLYWKHHGYMMEALGYNKDGSRVDIQEFNKRVQVMNGVAPSAPKSFLSKLFGSN